MWRLYPTPSVWWSWGFMNYKEQYSPRIIFVIHKATVSPEIYVAFNIILSALL
jgi:hypothetical protein